MSGRRIDGWKAIAAYFKRDRSTVMRWARERQLPVHRLPGGKQGTVFALEDELAAWALNHPDPDAAGSAGPPPLPPAPPPRRTHRRGLLVAGLVIAVLALALGWWAWNDRTRPQPAMPRDATVAATYLEARDTWGRRTGPDIQRAIALYTRVIRAQPDFAPAYAGLADAWLTLREYGGVEDSAAFGAARDAAERAVRLDPELPAAHRALGFILYWWSNDAPHAIAEFERALDLDPDDAQTHFWYANFLAYIGQYGAAEQHYARARLLTPGVQTIEVEYACAQWLAGRDDRALGLLTGLAQRYPADPTLRQCLAWTYVARGDVPAYAREYRVLARLRQAPGLIRNADAIDAALAQGPEAARAAILANFRRELADGTRRQHETSSFFASSLGDRATLVGWLRAAAAAQEHWDSASLTRRIAARWPGDREIQALLAQVRSPVPALPD